MSWIRIASACVACCVWTTSTLAAPESPPQESGSAKPTPLALTISGGGTKGAYMAGHLYYLGMLGHHADGPFEARIATGASAGAINALLVAFTACSGVEKAPTKSLFWRAWSDAGLANTFRPEKTGGTGVFTTDGFQPMIAELRAVWQAGLPERCDFLVGIAITRARARMVVPAPGLPALPRSREAVLVRITGRGPGRPPSLVNVLDPQRAGPELALPLAGDDARPFDALVELVLASAAFPIGFPPVSVAHCLVPPGDVDRCSPATAERALFMDGGIFDNQPLGLAVRAMRSVAIDASGHAVLGEPRVDDALPPGAHFYFLDPRARTWPSVGQRQHESPPDSAIDVVTMLFGMVESSASNALVSVFDERAEVRERLLVARTHFPQVSSTFNGLLERAFREFDFYLGMYNARRSAREHALGRGLPDPLDLAMRDEDTEVQTSWRPLACLVATLEGEGDASRCDGEDLRDFRILLQLTLDTLADDCRDAAAAGAPPPSADQHQCLAAMTAGKYARVPGVRDLPDAERRHREGEGQLAYQLRLLGRYGFHFRDMGLTRADAERAPDRLIRIAHDIAQRFADAQPRYGPALGVLSRIGVDVVLGYLPPRHSFHGTLGLSAELGWSMSLDEDLGWLRVGAGLGLAGLSTVFNAIDDYFALIPKAGLEVELFGSAAVQLRLGLRAGYQLSTADGFLGGSCDFTNEGRQPCSRFITEGYLAASVLGLIRLQVAAVYSPGLRNGQEDLVWVRPTLGFQLNSPF